MFAKEEDLTALRELFREGRGFFLQEPRVFGADLKHGHLDSVLGLFLGSLVVLYKGAIIEPFQT